VQQKMRQIKKIHFVGIGGVGMAGIAEVLITEGYQVSGSDLAHNGLTERLTGLGAKISIGHDEKNAENVDVVVVSSAIEQDNIEIQTAKKNHIPVVPRAAMLAELMRFRYSIAIAGAHGKTTTTSLISSILAQGGLDPTFVIGGKLNSAGSNARLGASHYLVAEADESDASFLQLHPMVAVVTNIDNDHLMTYQNDFEKLKSTFVQFIHNLPFYGLAILCLDCPQLKNLIGQIERPYVTYGFDPQADYRITNYAQQGIRTQFTVHRPHASSLDVVFNMPGKHNVQNALAAIVVATQEGVSDSAILKALTEFSGIGRRFHIHGEYLAAHGHALVVEDYGHHPQELQVTIEAARLAWPQKRIVMAFQPHRYSRTSMLFDDFVKVLNQVDELVICEVYSAGESPIVNADARALCRAIRQQGKLIPIYVEHLSSLEATLQNVIGAGDVLLLQGAGSIGNLVTQFVPPLVDPDLEQSELSVQKAKGSD